MLKKRVQDIVKDSSIYGLSKISAQAIGFFLIPLYTRYLTPEDYGVLNILGVASVSFGLVITFGLDSATYRFAGLARNEEKAQQFLGTAQWLNLISIIIFTIIAVAFAPKLSTLLLDEDSDVTLVLLGLAISVFSSISSITRAFLRIKRRAKAVAAASFANVAVSLGSTLLLVVFLEQGVFGALLGNVLGALAGTVVVFIAGNTSNWPRWGLKPALDLYKYALPVLPAQLLAFTIPLYSQWSVKELLSLEQLGIYAVALKFTLPLTLALSMFQQAYGPYKFEILKTDTDPKKLFRQIMNIFVVVFSLLVLFIASVGPELLMLMTPTNFHSAGTFVFSIALIPFFQGLYFMFSAGMEFAKSPWLRPVISSAGMIVLILTNHALIKWLGIDGAAISICLAWLTMAIGNFMYSKKLYNIPYHWPLIILSVVTLLVTGFIFVSLDVKFWFRISTLLIFLMLSGAWIAMKKPNLFKIIQIWPRK